MNVWEIFMVFLYPVLRSSFIFLLKGGHNNSWLINISQITVSDDTDGIHLNTQRIVGVLILDLVIKLPKIKMNLKFGKMNYNQFKLGSLCKITS